jgi:hypothetical protein
MIQSHGIAFTAFVIPSPFNSPPYLRVKKDTNLGRQPTPDSTEQKPGNESTNQTAQCRNRKVVSCRSVRAFRLLCTHGAGGRSTAATETATAISDRKGIKKKGTTADGLRMLRGFDNPTPYTPLFVLQLCIFLHQTLCWSWTGLHWS